MVVATMAWLSGSAADNGNNHHHLLRHEKKPPPETVGILAFETARAMSRLVSLYNSLTDEEIIRLKQDIIKSQGVSYLNSIDENFLLNLACTERLEDLNRIVVTASRLGEKCSDIGLKRLDLVYADLKLGIMDIRKLEFGTRSIEKIIEKMEKLVSTTSNLYAALETLSELETHERKINQWKKITSEEQWQKINFDLFNTKIIFQRKQVKLYKEFSLWNQTFDKSVGLIARIICTVYARICTVFEPYISGLPHFSKSKVSRLDRCMRLHPHADYCLVADRDKYHHHQERGSKSSPMAKTCNRFGLSRFRRRIGNIILLEDTAMEVGLGIGGKSSSGEKGNVDRVFKSAPPSTVGGSGLAIRYANVIIMADRCFNTPENVTDDNRNVLYDMLPERLKITVRSKLKSHWMTMEESSIDGDGFCLAEGWRDPLEGILGWLAPVAYDTVRWQAERNLERQKFEFKPTALLLHTLHYSDLEKTEAAIVEVLVGLSCIYMYENASMSSDSDEI